MALFKSIWPGGGRIDFSAVTHGVIGGDNAMNRTDILREHDSSFDAFQILSEQKPSRISIRPLFFSGPSGRYFFSVPRAPNP